MSRGKRKNNAIIVGIEANTHTKFNNIIFFVVVNKKLRKKHDNKKYMYCSVFMLSFMLYTKREIVFVRTSATFLFCFSFFFLRKKNNFFLLNSSVVFLGLFVERLMAEILQIVKISIYLCILPSVIFVFCAYSVFTLLFC